MQPVIYVFNESKIVIDADAQSACAAIQRQLAEHFEPIWKCTAVVHFAAKDEVLQLGAWKFRLADTIDVDSALGYHTDDGTPSAIIDVALCIREGVAWTGCLSHEILEAAADPECVRCFDVGGKVYSLEVSDAVEDSKRLDGTEYQIDGVTVENFITPDWFIPGSAGPWDFLGVLPGPLTRTANGYDSTASIGTWTQHSGEKTRASKCIARKWSRRARRTQIAEETTRP